MSIRKKIPANETPGAWGPSTAAHFPTQRARDGFLRSVATTLEGAWSAEPVVDDDLGASVRWRSGHFLSLNDLAYAHGGRIVVTVPQRWG